MNPAQQYELCMAIADSPPSVQEEIARLRDELAARNALIQGLEQTGERFQRARMADIQARERAEFSASQWQQRAELAERQRDELAELLGDQGRADLKQTTAARPECGGSGQDIVHVMCVRCGGTENDAT